jgi:hypothetical protein
MSLTGRFRRTNFIIITVLCAASGVRAENSRDLNPETQAAQNRFFESKIRPLFADRCFKCHGPDQQKGGLRLDIQSAVLTGGDSGPAIVPGKPDESLLIEAINYASLEMPPQGKLPAEDIALLTRWIEEGAFFPDDGSQPRQRPKEAPFSDADRQYWAFQPPRMVEPPDVAHAELELQTAGRINTPWCRTDVDRFALAALAKSGLTPAPQADRITLIRRVTQGITGLPPTPEEVDAFLSDDSPEAYSTLVNRLLDSPRYGEHQARLWLDLVRYAESDGYKQDAYRPSAWRYRDYVVDSFNADKPYDRFLCEQLAGDELDPGNPEALIATGFYRQGIYEYNQRDVRGQWRDILNDVTETFSDVFLSLSVGCARCHDHKFDPILQKDYYRLRGFFVGLKFVDGPAAPPEQEAAYNEQHDAWLAATADVRGRLDDFTRTHFSKIENNAISKFAPDLQEVWNRPREERNAEDMQIAALMQKQVDVEFDNFPRSLKGEKKEQWEALQQELSAFDDQKPAELPQALMVGEFCPQAPSVCIPDKERLGEIAPGFLSVLSEAPAEIEPLPNSPGTSGRRAALAKWLTRPDHPLTSRIIVNRIWRMHFGTGLVPTTNDFGRLSEAPSHPELLDWLASAFVENGWSLKWLHRQLLLSSVYCQASNVDEAMAARGQQVDPNNRLLWRYPIRRLTGEQIRDAALMASGELDLRPGGSATKASDCRRSIYTQVIRNSRDPLLDVFDFPERFRSVGERHVTTTPTQSLFMMNGDWMAARSRKFAERIARDNPGGEDSRIQAAYRIAFGRPASLAEVERASRFIYEQRQESSGAAEHAADAALVDFCQAILNANEFIYLD